MSDQPIAYLRDAGTDSDPCYVPAAKDDPGAFPVYSGSPRRMTPSALSNETQRAIAIIHWVFSADGTKGERSMADEAINKISDPSFMPLITELQSYRSEGVTVKPLEWPDTPRRGQRVRSGRGLLGYTIAYYGGDDPALPAVYRWSADDSSWSSALETYDDAKAAAQADYESRIKSALQDPS